jgi:hypothetical protein
MSNKNERDVVVENGCSKLKLSVKRLKTKIKSGVDAWTSGDTNTPQSTTPGNNSGWTH